MRRLIAFPCEGERLLGTLDPAADATGLLIVSGGNEVRAGAHRGMAGLAQRIAQAGHPAFRFDRRGIGDSTGQNGGWSQGGEDLAAALAVFRSEQPQLSRIVALGNCDAATLLACTAADSGIAALILTNPWTGEDGDGLPPRAAIRRRYASRLKDPATWRRAITGGIGIFGLVRGLDKLLRPTSGHIAGNIAAGLARFTRPITIILATDDATAIGFRSRWYQQVFAAIRPRATLIEIPTASHSFQHPADGEALEQAVLAALR